MAQTRLSRRSTRAPSRPPARGTASALSTTTATRNIAPTLRERSAGDVFGAQLGALVAQPGLVPDAPAAVVEGERVQVADVHDRGVLDLGEAPAIPRGGGQAGPLEPVLLGRGAAVVGGPAVGQDGGEPGPAGVPLPRSTGQDGAVPVPGPAVVAGGVGRGHPVLGPGHVQRVTADPGVPAPVAQLHDRVLDGRPVVAGEGRAGLGGGQAGRIVGLQGLDPPVLALGGAAADEQPPAALGVRTTAGRSIHWAPKRDWSRVATVVKCSPSGERATTVWSIPSWPLRTR